eukprot:scaffold16662_cov162-Isochrysis_galbana.AAC.1
MGLPSSQRAGVGGELLMGRRPRPRPHPRRPALPLPRGIGALTRTSEAVPKLVRRTLRKVVRPYVRPYGTSWKGPGQGTLPDPDESRLAPGMPS